jgi:hypothetical protein
MSSMTPREGKVGRVFDAAGGQGLAELPDQLTQGEGAVPCACGFGERQL